MTSPQFNETGFEDSVFLDPAEESSQQFHPNYLWISLDIAGSIIKFLVYLAAVVSDIYLITILVKFKRLRNRINNLILIYAVLHMLFLLLGTLILIILSISTSHMWFDYFCLINNIDHLMITLSFYALTFLATSWYMLNYFSEFCGRVRELYRNCLVIALIILAIIQWTFTSILCFEGFHRTEALRYALEGISFVVCGIILICLSILKRFRKPIPESSKTEYAFTIPIIVFSLSFPYYIIRFLIIYSSRSYPDILYLLELLAQSLFFLPPILILYLLGKSNKYFKMGYLKCCKRYARNYDDDDLDSGSLAGSVQNVAFEKDPESIRF